MYRPSVRSLALAVALCSAFPAFSADAIPPEAGQGPAPAETPIRVPSPIPVGVLIAWKPAILTVRVDRGAGSKFGSDVLQPFRVLGRYTTALLADKFLARAEVEGGRFQTDSQGVNLGSDGWDVTGRLVGGTATQVLPGFIVIASAGFLTRYQRGTGVSGGAPEIGFLGITSNAEFEYRVAPALTFSLYLEGGLASLPYAVESRLGKLSDASEFRLRLQMSIDLTPKTAVDIGYDFTRWHASFAGTSVGDPNQGQALLVSSKDYALTIGLRWKP
jgi:hypothetical protein